MKIGILFQDPKIQEIPWQKHGDIYNRTENRVRQIEKILTEEGYDSITYSSLNSFLKMNKKDKIDILIPCIECCFERNSPGFISSLLAMEQICFTGSDSYVNTIVSDKCLFKYIAHILNIRTPKSIVIDRPIESKNLETITFPCILKYRYGSMSFHTIQITDYNELKYQTEFMLNENNGPILCEEYISGREISVPVIGTAPTEQILGVLEYTDLNHKPLEVYDVFWKGENDKNVRINILNAKSSIIKEITDSVHKLYRFLGYYDYARFDFRLDNNGEAYLLEGNPLPALSYDSAFDPQSYGKDSSFKDILIQIVENAARRYHLL